MKDRTRKICSALLTLTLFVGILLPMGAAPAQAQAIDDRSGFRYDENGDGTICITYLPLDHGESIEIPETIDGKTVTALDSTLFYAVDGVQAVTIPGTVKEIPSSFCDDQSALTTVVLKNGVETIGARAFQNDKNLSSVSLPNSLTKIGESAFEFCYWLSAITLPNGLTTIGTQAFSRTGLTALDLPDSVKSVSREAFGDNSALEKVTLSAGMTTLPALSFKNCTSLREVTIPASITTIASTAFDGCSKLSTIYYGGSQSQWQALVADVDELQDVNVIFGSDEPQQPETPESTIPTPIDVTATSTVDGVQLNWSIPLSDPWSDWVYDGFIIYRENASGKFTEIDRSSVMTYVDKDVKDGGSYTYWLCAYDGSATGDYSKTVTITYDANPFTTTTIRDTAIRIGNQEDGSTNFTGVDKLWLTTGTQGMRIDLIFPEEMDELKDQQLSVTVSGGGQTFQGTAVEYIGQQVSFTLALTGGKHLKPDTTYTVAVKDARGNTIAQTTLQSAGEETASWGFTNKDASYGFADLCRYYPASVALALSSLDKSHGEDGLCFGMALANALWKQDKMPTISGGHELLNTVSWNDTLASGRWQGARIEDYIKACNTLQFSREYADQTRANMNDYDGLVRAVKSGKPVVIGTWIDGTGHAVLAYDYKEDSNAITIYVQDPQCMPYQIATMTLKGSSGNWVGWSYERRSWHVDSSGAKDPNRYFSWRSATTSPDDDFGVDVFLIDAKKNIEHKVGEDLDNLWNGLVGGANVALTPITGTSAAWLEGSGSVTMQGLTDEITLADSDLNITADGASARVNFDRGVEAVSVSGSGTLGLSVSVGDVTMRFSGTAANGVTLTRDDDTLTFSGADSGSVVVSEGNATLESTTITPGQDVSVSFAGETEQPDEPASDLPYRDVRANDWFYDAVKFVSDEKLMTGTGANTFAPNLTTTRGMIVSILYRLEGGPQIAGSSPFTDVKDDDWYGDAVRWAERAGVVSGTSATTFAPNAAITREQLAAILMNYANYKHENTSARADLSKYSDAGKISSWANDVMAWAVSKGYISGMTATTLAPQGSATRAQVAAILQRYLAD